MSHPDQSCLTLRQFSQIFEYFDGDESLFGWLKIKNTPKRANSDQRVSEEILWNESTLFANVVNVSYLGLYDVEKVKITRTSLTTIAFEPFDAILVFR